MFGHCVQQMWIFNELMTFDDVTIWLNDWLCLWMLFRPLTGNYFTAIKTNAHTRGRMTCFLFLRAIFSLILVWFFLDVTKDEHLNFSSFSCISITHKIVLMQIFCSIAENGIVFRNKFLWLMNRSKVHKIVMVFNLLTAFIFIYKCFTFNFSYHLFSRRISCPNDLIQLISHKWSPKMRPLLGNWVGKVMDRDR